MSTNKAWFPEPLILNIRGKLHWPALITPSDKFNPEGSWEAPVLVPEDEAQQYIDQIDEYHDKMLEEARKEGVVKAKAKVKEGSRGYSEHCDSETGEPTGFIKFSASRQSKGTTSKGLDWTFKPLIVDSKGKPITDLESIYGGTEAIVRVALSPYYSPSLGFGISANGKVPSSIRKGLLAVQIIKLVQGDAGGEAFGDVEGGYEHTSTGKSTEEVAEETFEEQADDDDRY